MITRIDAANSRCFDKFSTPRGELVVVAGANGSGKTTLSDIPALLGDLLRSRSVLSAFSSEADVWFASDSPHSATALGWASWAVLRPSLEQQGFLSAGRSKPERPKETAEWALRNRGKEAPWSTALYRQVSSHVLVQRCEDEALTRLLNALRTWFPAEGA